MHDAKKQPILPFFLAALCQIAGQIYEEKSVFFSAREAILGAAFSAALVWLLLEGLAALNTTQIFAKPGVVCALWIVGLIAGLLAAAIGTILQTTALCRSQFPGTEGWLPILLLLLLLLCPALSALGRAAHVVLALAILCGAVLLVGLWGQLDWCRLSYAAPKLQGTSAAACTMLCMIPEYLALPLVADTRRATKLPWLIFALQAAAAFFAELLFGYSAQSGRYPAAEMLRAWNLGAFSRVDALAAGLWLLLALFRLLWIEGLLREIARILFAGKGAQHEKRA